MIRSILHTTLIHYNMRKILLIAVGLFLGHGVFAQEKLDEILPIRAFAIAAPRPAGVEPFVKLINDVLGPAKVNTLILRVDWNYQYESHPELRDSNALSRRDVRKMVDAAKKNGIRIIPQVNLLGHQSWDKTVYNLLRVYPQFDETPSVIMPAEYKWPNPDGLYCKSYCPLHPDVHKIVFALIDEITKVFETDAFHAGMDEVFYIGHDKCPRCQGRDKAELFAGEVTKIRNHLASTNKELWIWGDRLIDGKATGIGLWEASYNNTHRAIDMIPKDVVITDWHYNRADQTPVLFAAKGLRVVTCSWNRPKVAIAQVDDMVRFRAQSSKEMKPKFYGIGETIWSGAEKFMKELEEKKTDGPDGENTPWFTFKAMYDHINRLPIP